jgi:hypothetical protein
MSIHSLQPSGHATNGSASFRLFPREPAAFLRNARAILVGMPVRWVRTAIARLRPPRSQRFRAVV